MDNTVSVVDENAGRRKFFNGAAMNHGIAQGHSRTGHAKLRHRFAHAKWPQKARQQPWFVGTLQCRLIKTGIALDISEDARWIVRGFRRSEKQESARIECIIESAANLFLQLTVKIDEHVAA